jgi:acetyl esterase
VAPEIPQSLTFAERLEIAAARALTSLPAPAKRRIAGPPIVRDGLELDLNTQFLLKLDERSARQPLTGRSATEAREELRHSARVVAGPPIAVAEARDTTIAGADGPLKARLYVPEEAAGSPPGPLVVFYHGGGWVAGDLDTHDRPCRLLAKASGARVLSVDYRLAPEHPFPAPVDDALAAFRDAVARAGELGADPNRIAVAGDSAGGHLATVTAQSAVASGGPRPAFQLLIYPVTDLVEVAPSRLTFAAGFSLTKANMDWYEEQLLGTHGDRHDPRASPLRAADVKDSPPALVVTAGFDPLRDEGEAYARKLHDAGVHTVPRRYPGYIHGFTNVLINGPGGREAIAEMGGVLRSALTG